MIADVKCSPDYLTLRGCSPRLLDQSAPSPPATLHRWFRSAPDYLKRLWGIIHYPPNGGLWIMKTLLNGGIEAACDSCHSWLFDDPHPDEALCESVPTDWNPAFLPWFCPEMDGTAPTCWALVYLIEFHAQKDPSLHDKLSSYGSSLLLRLWCDNKSTTKQNSITTPAPGITEIQIRQ